MRAVCVISGGMDSALAAFIAKNSGYEIVALHFDYGQKTEQKERECFHKICDDLGVLKREILDAHFIAQIGANALTDANLKIQKTGIKKGIIPNTYVPFRNGIFLSIAAALAQKEGAEAVFIGVVEEDSSGYPDCSENFIKAIENAINLGTNAKIAIKTPLVHLNKGEIVAKALEIGVKLEHTWSCYENNSVACGLCDSCRLRLDGFKKAGASDKIAYER